MDSENGPIKCEVESDVQNFYKGKLLFVFVDQSNETKLFLWLYIK